MKKLLIVLKGMAMGFADVIPGVSGGTIALVAGIYVQFIEAIKSVNFRWILPLFAWIASGFSAKKRDAFLQPLLAIHWGFLVPLGAGIVLAFGIGSVIVPYLMDRFPSETAAFFIGLILASTIVPYRQMSERGLKHVAIAIAAALVTFFVVGAHTTPALHWGVETETEALSLEDFMRQHPSMRTAEEVYCPNAEEIDNVALRDAIALDANQPEAAAHLDFLCAQLETFADDLAASVAFRDEHNLGRKDEANPFNNVLVPANTPVNIAKPALWYIFLAGVIGICAMVLPGISGSFFLLVLGVYQFMLSSALKGFIYDAIHLELPVTQGIYVAVFCAGCLLGLLTFARVMSVLFERFRSGTLAALVGTMLGSLRALWPWKLGEPHTGVENVMPVLDASLAGAAFAFLLGAALVIGLTIIGAKFGADE